MTFPPARIKADPYYTKFTWAREFTVLGRGADDAALLRANDTIRKMFAYRHDILKALMADGVRLVVLGPGEGIADLPEYREAKDLDRTARFLDYSPRSKVLVVDQKDVLGDPLDPYGTGSQVIRVLARALYHVAGTRPVDPDWTGKGWNIQQYELRVQRMDVRFDERLKDLHGKALAAGKWMGTPAAQDHAAYWVGAVLAYFDAAGRGTTPGDAAHPIATREALAAYDRDLFALVEETLAYKGKVDWRYGPYNR